MKSLVFWHGWGMRAAAWHSLSHHLKDRCTLHLPSLPGYDGTPAPAPYSADSVVDALLAPHNSPVVLCGWSLGAMLALLAAHRHPEKIERLILFSATPSFVQRDGWPHGLAPKLLADFTAAIESNADAALRQFITLFNHNDEHARSNVRELGDLHLPPQSVLDGGLALLRDLDLRHIVAEIRQPTLLIHGARDPLMPLPAAQWLAENLQQAQLDICPHAAHAPFISDPVHCAHQVTTWLETA